MLELLASYGLVDLKRSSQALELTKITEAALAAASKRKTFSDVVSTFTAPVGGGSGKYKEHVLVRSAETLKLLSSSPLPSRAIRMLRNGVTSLPFGIQPAESEDQDATSKQRDLYKKAIETVYTVLSRPNPEDNDFASLIGPSIEDMLVFDAGCWEYVDTPEVVAGKNNLLHLYTVPGYTIAVNPKWSGDPAEFRWRQTKPGVREYIELLDKDLEYIAQRKRTWSFFGLSQLETAVEIMEAWLGVSSFQKEIASSAYPPFLIYLGNEADDTAVDRFRAWWDMEVLGKGMPRPWGNTGKPETISLKPADSDGLYLKYFEMLVRIFAFCFDLKPQDFGLERDVNRNTAEVSQASSTDEARRPLAALIASRINSRVLPRIADLADDTLINDLNFFWIGVDPREGESEAKILDIYVKDDVLTLDEARADLDRLPHASGLGKLTHTAYKTLMELDPLRGLETEQEIDRLLPESNVAE